MRILAIAALAACSANAPAPATTTEGIRSPPIIDSHVHLAFWPVADQLAKRGVLAAVDLAAPTIVTSDRLDVIASGPMLTRPGGYPLDSWGRDGYGIGCGDAACVTQAIDKLAAQGARVIKLALDDNGLDPALVPIAVAAAHAKNLKVAAHALSDRSAWLAAQSGVDVLAHTPVEPLRAETIAAWGEKSSNKVRADHRAVISTLAAFGGSDSAIANLRALRAAGVTVLYGTDLGNLRDAGPSADELSLLSQAGLDNAAIVDAMTTVPARYWGISLEGSWLVVDRDPRTDARVLLAPRAVIRHGKPM